MTPRRPIEERLHDEPHPIPLPQDWPVSDDDYGPDGHRHRRGPGLEADPHDRRTLAELRRADPERYSVRVLQRLSGFSRGTVHRALTEWVPILEDEESRGVCGALSDLLTEARCHLPRGHDSPHEATTGAGNKIVWARRTLGGRTA